LNKGEDRLVKLIEYIRVGRPSSEDYWEKYLSMCGPLEPLMRLKLGIPQVRGQS
jgi:hypothetical protein